MRTKRYLSPQGADATGDNTPPVEPAETPVSKPNASDSDVLAQMQKKLQEQEETIKQLQAQKQKGSYEDVKAEIDQDIQVLEEKDNVAKRVESASNEALMYKSTYPELTPIFDKIHTSNPLDAERRLLEYKKAIIGELGNTLVNEGKITDELKEDILSYHNCSEIGKMNILKQGMLQKRIQDAYHYLVAKKQEENGASVIPKTAITPQEKYLARMYQGKKVKEA